MKKQFSIMITLLMLSLLGYTSISLKKDFKDARNRIAILRDIHLGIDLETIDMVAEKLQENGFETAYLSAEEACDPQILSPEKYFLYIIPKANHYPEMHLKSLKNYLNNKGNLMVLGRPTFTDSLFNKTGEGEVPVIETVVPMYKTYQLNDIVTLKINPTQKILTSDNFQLSAPSSVASCYVRPEGKGFEHGYKWRWIPLIKAFDKKGVERGSAVWILLNNDSLNEGLAFNDAVRRLAARNSHNIIRTSEALFEGSICAVCAIDDPAVLKEMSQMDVFGNIARRISNGVFLSHAGSQYFSYWPNETVQLGAVAVNRAQKKVEATIRISIYPKGSSEVVFQKKSNVTLMPGASGTVSFTWTPGLLPQKCYIVKTELIQDGNTIDMITHEIGILSIEKKASDEFVTVKNGDFWLKGKKWYPIGINYWPRYYIGLEIEDLVYYWLSPGFYNPEEVEKDLTQMESIGVNFIEIRADVNKNCRTLLDFLRRCEIHNIKVMVSLSSDSITDDPHYFQVVTMPFHFQKDVVDKFVHSTRLSDNSTILGYDIIWEPAGWVFSNNIGMFGFENPNYRQRWDGDWAKWIDERYESLHNAEKDWGMQVPLREDGHITSPSNYQLTEDGRWSVMVAAYRRFMDDLMSRKWNDATQNLRQIDPNHLISFRQGGLSPLDFTFTATSKHIDFSCAEGYEYRPDDEKMNGNSLGFLNRYIHYITNGKPIIWGEFGSSVWNEKLMKPEEQAIEKQALIHEMIYKVALKTGANGAAPWWWPGGYRLCERADFGVTNPDGTLRPSGILLQKYADLFSESRTYPKSDIEFSMDRDAHCGGLWHFVGNEGQEAYKQAVDKGQQIGIHTPGSGTTSANTPLIAVGNTEYNAKNPPKYLNAEFNWFKIKIGNETWIEVANGDTIQIAKNKTVMAKSSVGNLQEAVWVTAESCGDKPGAVYLASTNKSDIKVKKSIQKDIPWLQDSDFGGSFLLSNEITKTTSIELQMTAENRAWFGEKLRFTLVPVAN